MSIAGRFGWRWYAGVAAAAVALAPVGNTGRQTALKRTAAALPLRINSPAGATAIGGNVVFLDMTGGPAGAGYAVFVDADPVAVNAPIPNKHGVVLASSSPIVVGGMTRGAHRLMVVSVTGGRRLGPGFDSLIVAVGGPTLVARAAATSILGNPWTIDVSVTGVRLVPPDGDTTQRTGHLEFVIDEPLPDQGSPVSILDDNVVHTEQTSVPIAGLGAGDHTVWVVLADGTHRPFDPYVADLVRVTVKK